MNYSTSEVLKNRDLCNIIYTFCDAYRSPLAEKQEQKHKYYEFAKDLLKVKYNLLIRKWKWHVRMPDIILPMTKLNKPTRMNL